MFIRIFILVSIICILCASGIYAQSNNFDLLLGLGDFEKCNFSKVMELDEFGVVPTSNLNIANGWMVAIGQNSIDSYVFKLVKSDTFTDDGNQYMEASKSYQFIGINNAPGSSRSAQFFISAKSNPKFLDETFHIGDTLVFHLDKMISSNFVSGHQGASVGVFYQVAGDNAQYRTSKDIDLSAGFANNVDLTINMPNVTYVRPYIQLYLGENTTPGKTTGILLAGAKIFVVRNGTTVIDNDVAPYQRNRAIQTNVVNWNSQSFPPKAAAKTYDYIGAMASEYPNFSILRKLNPNIKIYIIQGGMDSHDFFRSARWCLSPFKMDYVIAKHPDWLLSQTNPKAKNDPDTGSSAYVGQYANLGGYGDRYIISKVADPTYQTEWANSVIELAKTAGADGVWIDNCGILLGTTGRDGVSLYAWEVQQFLHGVIPKLKAAGLTAIVNNAQQNLDGSAGWNGEIAELYFNPAWRPTAALSEAAGYSANTPENTPDVFFREFSFIGYGFSYNQSYWLRCINDADIISTWNAALPKEKAKRIQYSVNQFDTANNPAYDKNGKAGWIPFALASFLLCTNDYVSLGISIDADDGSTKDAMVDLSITKRLGTPDGPNFANGDDPYCRCRRFKATDDGGLGGVVVVNANDTETRTYTIDFDATDESGNSIASGTKIELKPHTGRIFLQSQLSSPLLEVNLSVPSNNVASGQTTDITLTYHNKSNFAVKDVSVQVRVPDQLTYVAGSAEKSGGSYSADTSTVVWTVKSILPDGTGTRTFRAIVNE